MAYEPVTQPMTVAEAFRGEGASAYQTQAAFLLILGGLVHFGESEPVGSQAPAEDVVLHDFFPPEDLEALRIPASTRRLADGRIQRYTHTFVRESIQREFMEVRERYIKHEEDLLLLRAVIPTLAERVLEDPSPLIAAQLCAAALASPDELARVAAATSYADMTVREEHEPLHQVLVQGSYSQEPLVQDVALNALARLAPDHKRFSELAESDSEDGEAGTSHTSLLVHGTRANRAGWWKPGQGKNFHHYLLTNVDPQLYAGTDWRGWSGRYTDAARALGALDLMDFVASKGFGGLDLFAHSHGGNVAFLASRGGMKIGRLVALSCPVHWNEYRPDFRWVNRVISIHVRLDLVILADRGGQRFPKKPGIHEIVLKNRWYGHSDTHEEAVWVKENLASRI